MVIPAQSPTTGTAGLADSKNGRPIRTNIFFSFGGAEEETFAVAHPLEARALVFGTGSHRFPTPLHFFLSYFCPLLPFGPAFVTQSVLFFLLLAAQSVVGPFFLRLVTSRSHDVCASSGLSLFCSSVLTYYVHAFAARWKNIRKTG